MLHDMTGGFNKAVREKQSVNSIYFLAILDCNLTPHRKVLATTAKPEESARNIWDVNM
jgi:hypothetical protein